MHPIPSIHPYKSMQPSAQRERKPGCPPPSQTGRPLKGKKKKKRSCRSATANYLDGEGGVSEDEARVCVRESLAEEVLCRGEEDGGRMGVGVGGEV